MYLSQPEADLLVAHRHQQDLIERMAASRPGPRKPYGRRLRALLALARTKLRAAGTPAAQTRPAATRPATSRGPVPAAHTTS